MQSKPTIVGVTGGIGSGKSTICKIFEVLGCKTYYADDRAKWLMEHDESIVDAVKNLFGEKAYNEEHLNRKWIATKAFKDASLLGKLNEIVHPVVKSDFQNWVSENQNNRVLLKEAALLFENGSYKEFDACVLVISNEQLRVERVLARDSHRNEEGIRDIMGKQMTDDEKIPLADFVIKNNESESVIKQVLEVYSRLS